MRVCMGIHRYIHCIHYAIYSDVHIISNFMYILHQMLCYYIALLVKILHVLVVLVISPLGFREDLHGHNYVFSVLS